MAYPEKLLPRVSKSLRIKEPSLSLTGFTPLPPKAIVGAMLPASSPPCLL